MFRFENPQYLYLLAGIIILALIHYYALYSRKKSLMKYGDLNLLRNLYDGGKISAVNPKTNKPPRKGTFSDEMLITFKEQT